VSEGLETRASLAFSGSPPIVAPQASSRKDAAWCRRAVLARAP
jgi:hypothetical protein